MIASLYQSGSPWGSPVSGRANSAASRKTAGASSGGLMTAAAPHPGPLPARGERESGWIARTQSATALRVLSAVLPRPVYGERDRVRGMLRHSGRVRSWRTDWEQTEQLCRVGLGVENQVLAVAAPRQDAPGKRLLHQKLLLAGAPPVGPRQYDLAAMRPVRVEVDDGDNDVGPVCRRLGVGEDIGVGAVEEAQVSEFVQGRVLAAKAVEDRDVALDVARTVPIPNLVLVFFRVEVLLAPGDRLVLAQLEAVIDAVGRRQRAGQHQADAERRPAAFLQKKRQYVGRVGEEVRPQIFLARPLRQLAQIFGQFGLRIAPGEVAVGLGEAGLGQS